MADNLQMPLDRSIPGLGSRLLEPLRSHNPALDRTEPVAKFLGIDCTSFAEPTHYELSQIRVLVVGRLTIEGVMLLIGRSGL